MNKKTTKTGKKVLIIAGSPRAEGNSTILAEAAAAAAKKAGAEVEFLRLAGKKIGPCLACDGCLRKDAAGCVQKDDMQALYPKLKAADAIVIAGPVYWFSISAQVKAFVDRFYAFGAEGYKSMNGKKAGIILTYGDADPFSSGAVNALRSFQDIFAFLGVTIEGQVYGSANKPGEVRGNAGVMKEARELGRKLAA